MYLLLEDICQLDLTQNLLVQTEDVWGKKKTMHFLSVVGKGGLVFMAHWKTGNVIFENRFRQDLLLSCPITEQNSNIPAHSS